jgi:hypothetical protein
MSTTLVRRVITCLAAVLVITIVTGLRVSAIRIGVTGDQLILSGPVRGDETEKVMRALDENPAITSVILRNSPGGNARPDIALARCSGPGACERPSPAIAIPHARMFLG